MIHRTYNNASNFNIFHPNISQFKQTFINIYPNRIFDKMLANYLNRIYTTPNLPTASPIDNQPPGSLSSLPATPTNPSVAPPLPDPLPTPTQDPRQPHTHKIFYKNQFSHNYKLYERILNK